MKNHLSYFQQFRTAASPKQLQRFTSASMKRCLTELAWLADSEIIYRELRGEK